MLRAFRVDLEHNRAKNHVRHRSRHNGTLIHAAQVAVMGTAVSPGLFDVLALLGREKTIARLE